MFVNNKFVIFAIYLQKNNTDRSVQISDKLYPFLHEDRNLTGNRTEARYLIGNTYVKLLQEKRETQVPEMKFYIEIPYLRPMLPILEVLKKEGIEYYYKRIKKYHKIELIELNDSNMEEEAKEIIKYINTKDYVITLEIGGNMVSSEQLSQMIDKIFITHPNIVFIIGGSDGISNSIKNISNYKLSFSKLTFPHQLFRIILLEQIYRSFKIMNNETYHK